MEAYTDELEADLIRYYQTDLRDLWRGGLSLRRVGVLIAALPPDSALMSAIAPHVTPVDTGKPPRQWTTTEHLLATIIDAINYQSWVTVSANSKRPPKKPKPLERPSFKPPERRRLTAHQLAEIRRRNHGSR